ncbi:MAG: division/cell wall cluster transcriptional repressor MraZ [Candidatus Saccharimonadales bacterium]
MGKHQNSAHHTKIKTTSIEKGMATIDYFERRLDDKKRLTIPSELRAEFKSGVIVTRGFRKYLHLYSKTVWDDLVEPALKGDILDEETADINVQFRTGKIEGPLDAKQGRILLDQQLLDYAGIGKDIVAVRAGQYWRLSPKPRGLSPGLRVKR